MGNTGGKVQARNTPGRSLMPRRERDSFPKSPSNPALKKASKDDEKEETPAVRIQVCFSRLILETFMEVQAVM